MANLTTAPRQSDCRSYPRKSRNRVPALCPRGLHTVVFQTRRVSLRSRAQPPAPNRLPFSTGESTPTRTAGAPFLIQRHPHFRRYHPNVPDLRRHHAISKLQPQPARRHHIALDRAAAPRTSINSHPLRRSVLAIEPSAAYPVHAFIQHPNCVCGIFSRHQHAIARAQICLSHFLKPTRLSHTAGKRSRIDAQSH